MADASDRKPLQELFIEELAAIRGGTDGSFPCPTITSMMCGEEQFPCSLC
jgi:hypothetical protein